MKAYKVFNPNWTCKNFQYKVGKTFTMKNKPNLCNVGFHACEKAIDCFNYYGFDPKNKVAEVELLGDIVGNNDKKASNKIKIIREISWSEVLNLVNAGSGNTGNMNSGDRNSGYRNSGNMNSGDRNSGYRNSGNMNSGDMNSGDINSGDRNSGDRNSGNINSGYRNSGNRNSGNINSGNINSGNINSGNINSGNINSGYRNSGNMNSGDRNSGIFNTNEPKARIFNKQSKFTITEMVEKDMIPNMYGFYLTKWILESEMTDQEKVDNPKFYVSEGYLKVIGYKEAWAEYWKNTSQENKQKHFDLPNFNAKIFEEITGIVI